ncbi:uncharacterized protein SAPINGB_P003373 [Magnusiomyces paraingens]|uniref:Peroxisomal membrane protein PMP47B n=1 Tax=Magnusiomyces paraingens TaxID=2606893 RepID=A0A5E8BRD1_9ASCO|nr:uncharacterized protein SAPINGB_P003373 [Saprochaete ingens]VVT53039.1 unnamed protein product [Saprochaete ingens]
MASNDNVAHALAGAGGGALSMVVTYPLITLSTRAQTESRRSKKEQADAAQRAGSATAAEDEASVKRPTSALEAARQIIQREGVSGLYSGLDSALFGISVTNFVYYYFYEGTRSFYETSKRKAGKSLNLSTLESMAAGAIAGSATVVLTNPIWVVNTRMTVKENSVKDPKTGKIRTPGTLETVAKIIREDGFKPFFAGILPALVLVINPILQYTIFEQIKNTIEKKRKLGPIDFFLIGAIGKIFATSITYPYITLKSRLQLKQKDGNATNSSLIGGLIQIIKNEGVGGLYGGIATKVTQSAITSAFLFLFKEQLYAIAVIFLTFIRKIKLRK